jgi:hypothetical protein
MPVQVAQELDRILGQPLRATSCDLGLLPTDTQRHPSHHQGRQADSLKRRPNDVVLLVSRIHDNASIDSTIRANICDVVD